MSTPQFFYRAYRFTSKLALAEVKTKLNGLGPWEWDDRDSDTYGDYLSAYIPEDSWLKLYELEAGSYKLDIKFRPQSDDEAKKWPELHAQVVDKLLPGLGASQVAEAETEDS